jgi:iron complex outermembrane receptor protein
MKSRVGISRHAGLCCAGSFTKLTKATLVLAIAGASLPAMALSESLADLSLEELGNIEITSVSKHAERLADAPASIFVITNDDIRRSGATSLPEALRLAPNLQIGQVSASAYAISARGFNNAIGNKLLVLIDGRTVYTPLYSGVNWDTQNVMLEDVERIEVISGPGATLWGANAVNGVINVITRAAQASQGGLAVAGGSKLRSDGALRYGGKIGDDGHYRVYAMGFGRDNTDDASGKRVSDGWHNSQAGFRADWGSASQGFTLQGDAYQGKEEPSLSLAGGQKNAGANLLGRWNHVLENGSTFQLQAYYDYTKRESSFVFDDETNTFDIELQHSMKLTNRHQFVWGGGYRYTYDRTRAHFDPLAVNLGFALVPAERRLEWSNLFMQDEMTLSSTVTLTLGAKAETNVYTNLEILPSARIAWKPDNEQLVWGALSRAVRAPARVDSDFRLYLTVPPGVPVFAFIKGGPGFQSEVADVAEIGYRAQPSHAFSYSITAFYSYYDKLRSGQTAPAFIQNMMEGTISGIEAWGNYQVTEGWRLSAGLTTTHEQFKLKPGSTDPDGSADAANDPANTWMLRSTLNLTDKHDFDVTVRHVSALPNPAVPHYTAVDARLAWRPASALELSLTVQNLFKPHHTEFASAPAPVTVASEIDRGVYIKTRWTF